MYDDDGRLLYTQPEVEWDDTEQAWALALGSWRDEHLCPLCGWPKEICQDPANDGRFEALGYRCHVTTAIRRAQDAARNPGDGVVAMPHQDAVTYSVRPRDAARSTAG